MILFRGIKKGSKDFTDRNYFRIILLTVVLGFVQVSYGQVDAPKILSVSLHTGKVEIEWEKSINPQVVEYRVQYGKYVGNPFPSWTDVPLAKIGATQTSVSFNPSVLLDVDPYKEPVTFAIKALTSDDESKSDRLGWDSTIYLTKAFDACLAQIELNWTGYDYNMWPYSTKEYQIYLKEDDADYKLYDIVSNEESQYVINDLTANSTYKIYVSAVADNAALDASSSNEVEIDVNMEKLPEYIYADYATYNNEGVEVEFLLDPSGELENYNLLRSNAPEGPFDSIVRLQLVNNKINYIDKLDYTEGPFYYKLDAINFCNNNVRSSQNSASSVLLDVEGEPAAPELIWNAYENWSGGVDFYEVERKLGNSPYEILVRTATTGYVDESLSQVTGEGQSARVCYKVSATEFDSPYGENATSYSNEKCIELPVNIRFEYNAFTPGTMDGNDTYGPRMDFVPDEFEFSVLDRGGHEVFKTTDPNSPRWDGTYKGKYVIQGAYMYIVRYRMGKGKRKVIRGGFVVVYP